MAFQFELWKRLVFVDPAAIAQLLLLTAMGRETLDAWERTDFERAREAFVGLLDGAAAGFARQCDADTTIEPFRVTDRHV